MAIGASRASVLGSVLQQRIILAAAGIALGGLLTAVLAPAIAAGMGVPGTMNLATFLIVPVALFVVQPGGFVLGAVRRRQLFWFRLL